ncbi:DUF1934 domain-containing protein [Staphylococcus sp. 17KM0847]|uniref:DUF1934 domain-containing protein n=1 Tax=Staphylococcus sp. 17KM0847 TaxID=2583989 RepID=UPI0015DCF7C0|nr:DUF1934 family protein [Staphylococcus sp. 17KM0847]QLK85403.1 DUF1934 family protein [Staphylococcus sp. 17KM0847]
MEQHVKVQVHQTVKQGDTKNHFNHQTQGIHINKNASFIRYDETSDEARTTHVTVKITDADVKIIRKGDVNMTLHFVEGQDTITYYHIAEGKMVFTVRTLRVLHFVTPEGGKLKIHYKLYQENHLIGTYQYELTYKEC